MSLTNNLSGTTNDLTVTVNGYNPASQITGIIRSNNAYVFSGYAAGNAATTTNGLNQQTNVGSFRPNRRVLDGGSRGMVLVRPFRVTWTLAR